MRIIAFLCAARRCLGRVGPVAWLPIAFVSACAVAQVDSSLTTDESTTARIELADGSIIFGMVTDYRDDVLVLETSFGGEVNIDATQIIRMDSPLPIELLLDDARVVKLESLDVEQGKLALPGGETIALTDIGIVNPEAWEEGKGYHWTGTTGLALAYNRGNTETDNLNINLDTTLESTRDRYTIRGNAQRDFAYQTLVQEQPDGSTVESREKVATADNWRLLTKYDYFLEDPRNYVGVNLNLEADDFADINLRTYLGPYYGRRVIDNDVLTFDAELGLVYVDTDFIEAEDTNYPGGNWNFTAESGILGNDSRLYFNQVGIYSFEDSSQLIINTTLGLGFPLVLGLEGAAEVRLDYDGGAAEGKENLDQVYSFRVGYGW